MSHQSRAASGSTFRVYYMRPEWFREGIMGVRPDPLKLDETHVFVRSVEAANLEHVFALCQGEVWSPNGEARELIRRLKIQHTSMSVGDVVIDSAGRVFMVAMFGFADITDGNDDGEGEAS